MDVLAIHEPGRLSGYNGKEKYIDLNVFYGNEEEFENYGMKD